jgi:hypothetical protein
VYEIIDDFRTWVAAKFRRRAPQASGHPVPAPAE